MLRDRQIISLSLKLREVMCFNILNNDLGAKISNLRESLYKSFSFAVWSCEYKDSDSQRLGQSKTNGLNGVCVHVRVPIPDLN